MNYTIEDIRVKPRVNFGEVSIGDFFFDDEGDFCIKTTHRESEHNAYCFSREMSFVYANDTEVELSQVNIQILRQPTSYLFYVSAGSFRLKRAELKSNPPYTQFFSHFQRIAQKF